MDDTPDNVAVVVVGLVAPVRIVTVVMIAVIVVDLVVAKKTKIAASVGARLVEMIALAVVLSAADYSFVGGDGGGDSGTGGALVLDWLSADFVVAAAAAASSSVAGVNDLMDAVDDDLMADSVYWPQIRILCNDFDDFVVVAVVMVAEESVAVVVSVSVVFCTYSGSNLVLSGANPTVDQIQKNSS